jgi:hypothetical protein
VSFLESGLTVKTKVKPDSSALLLSLREVHSL